MARFQIGRGVSSMPSTMTGAVKMARGVAVLKAQQSALGVSPIQFGNSETAM